jgi:hypothetical protein
VIPSPRSPRRNADMPGQQSIELELLEVFHA